MRALLMHGLGPILSESLLTIFTLVWTLASVSALMDLQGGLLCELLIAEMAREGLFATMASLVGFQDRKVREGFATFAADVALLDWQTRSRYVGQLGSRSGREFPRRVVVVHEHS